MLKQTPAFAGVPNRFEAQAKISARIERLPITRPVFWARNIIGAATFFEAIPYSPLPMRCRCWCVSGSSPRKKSA